MQWAMAYALFPPCFVRLSGPERLTPTLSDTTITDWNWHTWNNSPYGHDHWSLKWWRRFLAWCICSWKRSAKKGARPGWSQCEVTIARERYPCYQTTRKDDRMGTCWMSWVCVHIRCCLPPSLIITLSAMARWECKWSLRGSPLPPFFVPPSPLPRRPGRISSGAHSLPLSYLGGKRRKKKGKRGSCVHLHERRTGERRLWMCAILSYHLHFVCIFVYVWKQSERASGGGSEILCAKGPFSVSPSLLFSLPPHKHTHSIPPSFPPPLSATPTVQFFSQSNCSSPCVSIETNFFYPCLSIDVHCFSNCLLPSLPLPPFFYFFHSQPSRSPCPLSRVCVFIFLSSVPLVYSMFENKLD